MHTFARGLLIASLLAACGGEDDTCDPVAQTGCGSGLVCEEVQDGEPACFQPVIVRGQVFDLADDAAIAGARVVARDVNGAPASAVAVTELDGSYELTVPSTRDEAGEPVGLELTLRADAASYQSFPAGLRQALPMNTVDATFVADDAAFVLESSITDIGLIADPDAGPNSIHGVAEIPADLGGVLVVAEDGAGNGYSAIADVTGAYRIFNLAAGSYTVTAYARGVNYDLATVEVEGDTELDLSINDQAPGTVEGTVQIVNAPGGATTSVILVVESTFDVVLARGATPPGLRAPEPGLGATIAGAYTIEGVPAGRYVVLAAFENDDLVRDPDLSIGGTSILHIEVAAGATTVVDGFKVTEALDVFGPGATGPEPISSAPVMRWKDDSSEDEYRIEVINSFGEIVWDHSMAGVSGGDPEVTYDGDPLDPGMFYQFRATSYKDGVPISRTEDLKGVFLVQ